MVSTYLPKNCGIATFTAALLDRLRDHTALPTGCEIGVVAIADPVDELVYTDPIVHYDLRIDSVGHNGSLSKMFYNPPVKILACTRHPLLACFVLIVLIARLHPLAEPNERHPLYGQ